jgi:membrane associated rhomboid family serine protease
MTDPLAPTQPPETQPTPPTTGRSLNDYLRKTPITSGLLVFTIFIFILQRISIQVLGGDLVAALGDKNNELLRAGQYWRFFTPVFLHVNEIHVLLNMYALFQIGPIVEREFGRFRFLCIYVLSGIAGVILSLAFTNADSLGASGAIFGLIGAWGVFLLVHRKLLGPAGRSALSNVLIILVLNVGISFIPGIDLWAHFGGLITGAAIAWLAGPLYQVQFDSAQEKPQLVDTQPFLHAQLRMGGIALALLLIAMIALRGGV